MKQACGLSRQSLHRVCDRAYGKAGLAAAEHFREGSRVLNSVLLTTLAIGFGWSTMNSSQKSIGPFSAIATALIGASQDNQIL